MKEEIFDTEKLTFSERIKKDLGIKIIVFLFLIILPLSLQQKTNNALIVVLSFLYVLSLMIIITLVPAKKYIYQIRITSSEIKFYGKNFNKEWLEKFELKNTNIQIIEHKSKAGTIVGYKIIFKSANKKITVNKLYNWNNFNLYKLFTEFKNAKGEKIILDEKFLLDGIKKRAEYYYEWQDDKKNVG